MSVDLRQRIFTELSGLWITDPHTHINPHAPAAKNLGDLLGYHYYTELAHSAGMPKSQIEEPGIDPETKVARLVANLAPLENTIQYSWLIEILQAFADFGDQRLTGENWQAAYEVSQTRMQAHQWADHVLQTSRLEAVFLTNDFDDPLEGWDTSKYIPCLRTDDLVFHLAKDSVRTRLQSASGQAITNRTTLADALNALFFHFRARNARACAISLPPDFTPAPISMARAETAVENLLRAGENCSSTDRHAVAQYVFWTLADLCWEYSLPFDLMIGVNRGVYAEGVYQGRDLYDSRVSLIQYRELFNAFPQVTFPISVLASVTSQELASYAWIFPNVVTHGHWWYSNTPTYIEHDLAGRLEAVPQTKQIAYYSDMYKLEFALPKFNMYRRILAKVLAERYVIDRGWPEERAVDLGTAILKRNTEHLFRLGPSRH